jgi:predicted acylesterase/phospholipase RssA
MYQNVIFAGGGSRCAWQLGFYYGAKAAGLALNETVSYVASTSAGCAMATAAILNREMEALERFKVLTKANPGNIHWWNLKPGSSGPLLPHMDMYRRVMREFLTLEDLEALQRRTLEFLIARCPGHLPGGVAALLGFTVYGLEKRLTGRVHPRWSRRLGFQPLIANAGEAKSVDDLVTMVLAASCVPPVLPSPPYRGMNVLDGGMIDNVPAFMADRRSGRTLVLLSKQYRRALPQVEGRTYVQPSRSIRMDKFDYANPEGLQEVFELGAADGHAFALDSLDQTDAMDQTGAPDNAGAP